MRRRGGTGTSISRRRRKNKPTSRTTAFKAMMDNFSFAMQASTGQALAPVSDDARFTSDAWKQWPFNMMARGYLNWAKVMQQATTNVPGLAPRSADLVGIFHAANAGCGFPGQSPDVKSGTLELTREQSGQNLVTGFQNWLEDVNRTLKHDQPVGTENFKVGVECRRHAGQGRLPQRTHRTHSIRAHHRHRASRAGAHRSGVDHEVLHPGLVAAKFLRALFG